MSKRKKMAVAAGLVLALTTAGVAYAYWTASGTGNGSATGGSDAGVTITNVAFSGGPGSNGKLYPGGTTNVAFSVNNTSTATAVNVHNVVADQGALDDHGTVDTADDTYAWPNGFEITAPNCDAAWFSYSGTELAAAPGKHIAAGGTYAAPAGAGLGNGGTVRMTDETSTNQDGCKDASIKLHVKISNAGI